MNTERDKHAELFADYMIEAMARTRLRQSEIARMTGLSRTTISQIVGKKPHSLTGKLLLPERETVDKIAKAFGDPVPIARRAAGYSTEEAPPDQQREEVNQRAEEAARTTEMIENWMTLSPEEQARVLAMIRVIQADHPELLEMMKSPVKIVKAADLNESEAERDTG